MKKLVTLIVVSFALSSCSTIADALIKWQFEFPDNQAEEFIEDLIEDQTDYEIDLTPVTGDENQKVN